MLLTAHEAISRLQEGNARFVAGTCHGAQLANDARRAELTAGQAPFAVILGCSDSRVPVELVFDQGLGDLFVIRIAGNIVAPSQIGSVEFAVRQFGAPLVVVLGHSRCGAVAATLAALTEGGEDPTPHLYSIVDRIRPSVASLLETDLRGDPDALLKRAVQENVRVGVRDLAAGSKFLARRVEQGELAIVGAKYSLASGVVDFFDGVPGA